MLVLITGTTPAVLPTRHNNYHHKPESGSLIKILGNVIILMIETSNKPLEFHQHFLYSIKSVYVTPTTTKNTKRPWRSSRKSLTLQGETRSMLLTAAV